MFSEANSAFSLVYELDPHRREITHKKTKFGSSITDEFLIKKKKKFSTTHTHTQKKKPSYKVMMLQSVPRE